MSVTYYVKASLCAAFLLFFTYGFCSWILCPRYGQRLPPGPKSLPVLGNFLQVPTKHMERKFAEWGKIYGDVVYTRFLQTPVVILNSLEAAQDLLDKRSAKYSDRPPITLLSDLVGWGYAITGMPYGDRTRRHRRWMHDAMGSKNSVKNWAPMQRRVTYNLLSGLCDQPQALSRHINRFAASSIVEMAYGHSITSLDDEYVLLADKAMEETVKGGFPGLMLVDFLPTLFLKNTPSWLPGPLGDFIRKAPSVKAATDAMNETPYQMVKSNMASGSARPSLTASLIAKLSDKGELTEEDEKDIKGATGVLYGAGTETTVSTLSNFFLAMVLYPDVFKKARQEIDRVVGTERLPDFDDREQLPYVDCILQEVYRWGDPSPLGLPHRLVSDDEYRGYRIPAGSTVIANIWAMGRDERVYADPEVFRPERFENLDREKAEFMDPRRYTFGFGRRVCPGLLLADGSIWLAFANIIATLDITKARDASGQELSPVAAWVSGFVSQPVSYVVDIRPRSTQSVGLIQQMNEAATVL